MRRRRVSARGRRAMARGERRYLRGVGRLGRLPEWRFPTSDGYNTAVGRGGGARSTTSVIRGGPTLLNPRLSNFAAGARRERVWLRTSGPTYSLLPN